MEHMHFQCHKKVVQVVVLVGTDTRTLKIVATKTAKLQESRERWGLTLAVTFNSTTVWKHFREIQAINGQGDPTVSQRKVASCPRGFRYGSIYWDDDDCRNSNKIWGILPDGSYGRDTFVQYCCRNDDRYHQPIALPTRKPFILYRYGGRCQRVRGMRMSELYIKWDDENRHNDDNCRGFHPDARCHKNQCLHFCYYRR